MSLINQMLKDLDNRGSGAARPGTGAAPGPVRAVQESRGNGSRLVVLLLVLLLVIGGAAGWYFWQKPVTPQVKPVPAPQAAQIEMPKPPVPTVAANAPEVPVAAAPLAPAPVAAASAINPSMPTVAASAPVTAPAAPAMPAAPAASGLNPPPVALAPAGQSAVKLSASKEARSEAVAADQSQARAPETTAPLPAEKAMKLSLSNTLNSIAAPEPRQSKSALKGAKKRGGATGAPGVQIKETTPHQHAENAYNNAISLISAGQKAEAIAALETILLSHPKHAAARQTLVGLLLDAKRPGDAARVLEEGLTLDPKQTGMAMILARIQIERGGSAVALATLQRSLPHAVNRPDYLAFTAAMLQREKRHREAITHFAHAVRLSPQNAHWWMGYGVSLQAEGQPKEARQAFVRARDLRKLPPELQAFVEQKISQIGGV